MTSFELSLKNELQEQASRENAIKVRAHILTLLKKFATIEINLTEVNLTPSVADEIMGGLAELLGTEGFKQKIKILNATDSQMALMKHVVARRLNTQPNNKTRNE